MLKAIRARVKAEPTVTGLLVVGNDEGADWVVCFVPDDATSRVDVLDGDDAGDYEEIVA